MKKLLWPYALWWVTRTKIKWIKNKYWQLISAEKCYFTPTFQEMRIRSVYQHATCCVTLIVKYFKHNSLSNSMYIYICISRDRIKWHNFIPTYWIFTDNFYCCRAYRLCFVNTCVHHVMVHFSFFYFDGLIKRLDNKRLYLDPWSDVVDCGDLPFAEVDFFLHPILHGYLHLAWSVFVAFFHKIIWESS